MDFATCTWEPEVLNVFSRSDEETGYPDPPDAEFLASVFCRILSELRDELSECFALLSEERAAS
jgi:hypothetical protein